MTTNKNLGRRKRVCLTLGEKRSIIEALDEGETINAMAKKYGVTLRTISNLKNKDFGIIDPSEYEMKKRKTVSIKILNEELEDALLMWYKERLEIGEPVSGAKLCKKALTFNNLLNGSETFKATASWILAFKKRHDINLLKQGEELPKNIQSARIYCRKIQKLIKTENFDLTMVFNADECGILWKSLPEEREINPATARIQYDCSDVQKINDRVTTLFCSNANGTFTLPLLIIGKYHSSDLFSNKKSLPFTYKHHSEAMMNEDIFFDWYTNDFIPSVKEMQKRKNNYGRVLLLIDEAKCHLSKEILDSVNDNFRVEYIPTRIAQLVQPLCQGVIEKSKRNYRKALLTSLSLAEGKIPVNDFIMSHNLQDCCKMLATAFQSITQGDLRNCWKKLLGVSKLFKTDITFDKDSLDDNSFLQMVINLKDFENMHATPTILWLNADKYDPGWEILTDEEIIQTVTCEMIT